MDFTDLGSSRMRSNWNPTRRSRVGLQFDRIRLEWSCTRWSTKDLELDLDLTELDLVWNCIYSRPLAEIPVQCWQGGRLRHGVLVLPTSQHCSRVNRGSPSAISGQCLREGRHVYGGGAEVYLSFFRVCIAEESLGGSPSATPMQKATCTSFESVLA